MDGYKKLLKIMIITIISLVSLDRITLEVLKDTHIFNI
jgi:hypothetical protein